MASTTEDPPPQWTYPTRQCRLCFEECEATVELPPVGSPSQSARIRYYSADDPSLGQLICPCLCKGTSKYTHEGCLDAWRKGAAQKKSFWECDICHFRYKFNRLGWARLLENSIAHITITAAVALFLVFIFGYIADPIINLYIDPYNAASPGRLWDPITVSDTGNDGGWLQHFYKGLASVGVLSFARVVLMASPWHWYNLRSSGLAHGTTRPGATGQERVANISWVVLLVGVLTFLYTVFKAMNAVIRWFLGNAAFHIKEVPHDDDDDDLRPPTPHQTNEAAPSSSKVTTPDGAQQEITSKPAVGNVNGHEGKDRDRVMSSSADHQSAETSPHRRAVPMIPGSFEAAEWSFSSLDR